MHLVPNSWGVDLREFNPCHGQDDGKFCSDDTAFNNEDATNLKRRIWQEARTITQVNVGPQRQAPLDRIADKDKPMQGDEAIGPRLKVHVEEIVARAMVAHPDLRKMSAEMASHSNYVDDPDLPHGEDPLTHARYVAHNIVAGWALTSGDTDPLAKAMQTAAATVFNMGEDASTTHLDGSLKLYNVSPSLFQTAIRAQYEATQAWFKAEGIEHVTAYRGMAWMTDGTLKLDTASPVTLNLQPISSFSTDLTTAWKFADLGSAYDADLQSSQVGLVIGLRVPVKDVLSTPLTGFGCFREHEITVLGGRTRAIAYPTQNPEFEPIDVARAFNTYRKVK